MFEYIEGFRAERTSKAEGQDIFSVYGWDGRMLFQGTRAECERYVRIHKAKVADHERRVRASSRTAV